MLVDAKRPPSPFPKFPLALAIAGGFLVTAPLATFVLLVLKGLPDFAASHPGEVLIWVYNVTWKPALLAGVLLGGVVVTMVSRTRSFHQPFDVGRALSLGAVGGALSEAVATGLYRSLSHRLFSDFWIAGAMIAGCLAGGLLVAAVLWRLSESIHH
jgi:hypothetical protein